MNPRFLAPHPLAGWRVLATCLLAGVAGSSGATAVTGPGGTADQGRRLVIAAPAIGAEAPTLALVSGRIDAVDLKALTLTVRGRAVPLHPTTLRILGPGGRSLGGPVTLHPGMQVRFALEAEPVVTAVPAAPAHPSASASVPAERRIVLIYVDSTS